MTINLSTHSFAFALKQRYTDRKIEDLTVADCPLVAMMTKDENLVGEGTPVPLIYGRPQGVSGDLATAQGNRTNIAGKKFLVTAGEVAGTVVIPDKVIKGSRTNPGAFLRARMTEIDGLISAHGEEFNTHAWGNGGGSVGVIDSGGISTDTITLENPSDTLRFEEGGSYVLSDDDGSDSSHSLRSGTAMVVESVNREAGTVTMTQNITTSIAGAVAGDYIFREGLFAGDTNNFVTYGVEAFIAPTSTPGDVYGMTRTADPQRLAGCRVASADLAGRGIEDRLRILGSYIGGRYKGKRLTHGFLHPELWEELSIELGTRGVRPLKDDMTRFGFESLEMVTGGSRVKIYADPFCPYGHGFLLRMPNWVCHSMDKLVSMIDEDGLKLLRGATANEYECRTITYPGMSCNAPGWSGRVPLV